MWYYSHFTMKKSRYREESTWLSGGSRICCQVCLVHAFPIIPHCFLGKKSLGEPLHIIFQTLEDLKTFLIHITLLRWKHLSLHFFLRNSWSLPWKSNLFKRTEELHRIGHNESVSSIGSLESTMNWQKYI